MEDPYTLRFYLDNLEVAVEFLDGDDEQSIKAQTLALISYSYHRFDTVKLYLDDECVKTIKVAP